MRQPQSAGGILMSPADSSKIVKTSGCQQPQFTAAQIAAALGVKRQSVQSSLRNTPASGVCLVNGQESATWPLFALPSNISCRLDAIAVQRRYRTTADLLSAPMKQWEPALQISQICDRDMTQASKLRDALLPSLLRQHVDGSRADFEAQGLKDYAKAFGRVVTPRHWRGLFKRTIERDGGAENWNRLEIYLPENPRPKVAQAVIVSQVLADVFAELEYYIAACSNPHAPTEIERRGIWTLAFEKFDTLVRSGKSEKSSARLVREFLFARAPFMAASRDALLKAFNYKLAAYQSAQGNAKALRDGRAENGARFELPEDDRDLLIHRAVFYYRGDVAPAWRDLLRKGFSPTVVERYAGKSADKSHVPASVMDSIGPEVEIMTAMHQGPRAFDAIKGHITRSYDGISSLQCISGDDFTMNTYFFIPDGKGWFELTRGQVILFIDFRSSRILGWALEPRKSYSSLTIRSLCTHVFGEFGLPQVLYFERGIWENATLLKGKTNPFTFTEISQGLREFGITFKHAIRPRTKTVERIGGMFQDIAEAEPGYCGRDERRDAPESLRKQMAEVAARKVHPTKYFYSLDQWNQRISELVSQYNAETQQGHMLAGLSPDQAFEAHINHEDPPMQFDAGLRYLLAHDKRQAQVTLNGVSIQIGKTKFNYRGQEISHLVGREVLAWFDPENPQTIVVTDLDRANPICLERSENPNALESLIAPQSGTLGREMSRIAGQASHLKTRYNIVKSKFPLPQRQLLADAQARDLGEQIAAQKDKIAEITTTRDRQRSQARRFVEQTGVLVPERAQTNLRADEGKLLSDFLNAGGGEPGKEL